MMGMALSWIMMALLMGGELITGVLQEPPRDLASLIEPVPALEQMQQPTDEDALIALLDVEPQEGPDEKALRQAVEELAHREFAVREKAAEKLRRAGPAARPFLKEAARSDDPEVRLTAREILGELNKQQQAAQRVDMGYTRKLLAVRALEQMKSTKALPALKKLAESDDITLSAAAADAVAVIGGGKPERPSGMEAMKAIAHRLPSDTALLAIGEFVTGARTITLTDLAEEISKEADGSEAFYQAMGTTAAHMKASLQSMKGVGATHLVQVLGMAGNIRVDAAAMVFPDNWSDNPDHVWIAWVLHGLYDPERLGSALARDYGGNNGFRKIDGVPVYGKRWDPHIALVDRNTLAIVIGDVGDQDLVAGPIVRSLKAEPREELSPAAAEAMAQFERPNVRIGLGARMFLSPDLLAEGRRELAQEIDRAAARQDTDLDDRLGLAGMRTVAALLEMEELSGYMTTDGTIELTGRANDAAAATDLSMALKGLNDVFVDTAKGLAEGMDEELKGMFADMQKGPMQTASEGRKVSAGGTLEGVLEHISMLAFSQFNRMRNMHGAAEPQMEEVVRDDVAGPIQAP
jgi:hypothetical protein